MRIVRAAGGDTKLDCIVLADLLNPVEQTSWGRVKTLFPRE